MIEVKMPRHRKEMVGEEIAVLITQAVVREMGWAEVGDAEATLHKEVFDEDRGVRGRSYNVYAPAEGVSALVILARGLEGEGGDLVFLRVGGKTVSASFSVGDNEVAVVLPFFAKDLIG